MAETAIEFIWNDGGRSAAGFVGMTGDCVTRAIAIGTGRAYRDVYNEIGQRTLKSPRGGVDNTISSEMLRELGWQRHSGTDRLLAVQDLPSGIVIARVQNEHGRAGHMFALVDHVVHDTWNAFDDQCYLLKEFWTPPHSEHATRLPAMTGRTVSEQQQLTQSEFEKILRRLRALDNTASNDASTEGEKRNALRMMQSLMLTHNLSRDDIVDRKNVEHVLFTRMACPLNGRRACGWEKALGLYVTLHVCTSVQFYIGTQGHRRLFWFYGPREDVENAIALFRELLVTIAAAAQLKYGGYSRGSGASYAEGYVAGLPRSDEANPTESTGSLDSDQRTLVRTRTIALHSAARDWLALECGVRLQTSSNRGRTGFDPSAAGKGKRDGAKHEVSFKGKQDRLTFRE